MSTEFNDDLIPERIEDDPVLLRLTARIFVPARYSAGEAAAMRVVEDELVAMWKAEIRERAERPLRELQERRRRWQEWKVNQAAQGQEGQGRGDTQDADTKRAARKDKAQRASRKGINPRKVEMGPETRPTGGFDPQVEARGSETDGGAR